MSTTETHHTPDPRAPEFESPEERDRFIAWSEGVASEMDLMPTSDTNASDPAAAIEALEVLVGTADEPGYLYPDELGYPHFYDYPLVDQKTADDAVYNLYATAFRPAEQAEHDCGRRAAYLRTYVTVDTMDKGQVSAAGILTGRRAHVYPKTGAQASEPARLPDNAHLPDNARLPDKLVFHETRLYIDELVCESTADLLRLFRLIGSSKVSAG